MKNRSCTTLLLLATLSAPALFAQVTRLPDATPPATAPPSIKFDVVSFKRCDAISYVKNTDMPQNGDYVARHCQPISQLFEFAFHDVGAYELKNEPEWVDTEAYEFLAKVAQEDVATWQKMGLSQRRLMARVMLAESLNLKMHIEVQSRPIYALVVAKGGPKMAEHKLGPDDPPPDPNSFVHAGVHWISADEVIYTNATMNFLASGLRARLDRDVVDRTGLTGRYDFNLKPLPNDVYDPKSTNVADTDFAAIIDGVKRLGLKLEPAKADTSVLVVDHIDRPSAN